jgi:hypothetical protein
MRYHRGVKKFLLDAVVLFVFAAAVNGQAQSEWRSISKAEYDKAFDQAASNTNRIYPHVFTVSTDFIENGKVVRTVNENRENEAPGRYRIRIDDTSNGVMTSKFQIRAGDGAVYCSSDAVSWTGPSQYECNGPISIYGPRTPESVEYWVKGDTEGEKVKSYRQLTVYPAKGGKKDFRETISAINYTGLFLWVTDAEGTLGPRTVTLMRWQFWKHKAKFDPVVAPKN